ncbi:MAG: GGDEF domain-containing protein [Oleispira sp.]|nr:GGDEF domain-containing protein [Oleispira sp.]MBL4882725.1 GGDEF domain-containing protein [Oleispira sp.]
MLKQIWILIILLGVAFAAFTGQLSNSDQDLGHFDQIEYFSHEEELSLAEAQELPPSDWQSAPADNLSLGFDNDHYWFRLPLKNLQASETPWLFRSKYPLLDTLDLYLFADSILIQEFHTGDSLPFEQRPLAQPSFVFPLTITTDAEYVIYMHIQTSSSVQLSLSLQSESSFWQTMATENATSAAFYAILISMIFYNAVIFLIVRVRSYLYYVLYLSSFTLFMASIHGWAYRLLWPNSPVIHQLSVVFLIGTTICTAGLFTSSFLRLKEVRPDLHRIVTIVGMTGLLQSFISLFLPYAIMIRVGAGLAIIAAAIAMFSTMQEWFRSRRREVMMFIIAWTTVLIGFLLYSGQKFGFLPVNAFTEHAIEIGAVLEALLLALGLADRINSERKARIATQERMLEVQLKANQELDNKVRERTEELEIMNGQLQTASITDSLTQVKNRHYFDKKLPAEYRRAYREKSWISLLILDIDNFKHFNDNHGHQAGDEILKVVAAAIEDIVKRPSDAVSRYGGEEFTVLLPNTPKEGAYQVAERIRNHIQDILFEWQGETLTATISIGLASCIPPYYEGEATLLKQADDFLYVAKDHGRNQVVYEGNDPTSASNTEVLG